MSKINIKDIIETLAKMDELDYQLCRIEKSKELGLNVSALDKKVKELKEGQHSNKRSLITEVEPWDYPISGKDVFDETYNLLNKYLVLQPEQLQAISLWAMYTYCYDEFDVAPKLLITSPEKRCGKTTLVELLGGIVSKPLIAANTSTAAIFRLVNEYGCTLILDEADTYLSKRNDERVGIINSGYRKKSANVYRVEGDQNLVHKYSTWGPQVIAMINTPIGTIVDRAIIILMRRKTKEDQVERFIYREAEKDMETLSRKLTRWAIDNSSHLKALDPEVPMELNDRAMDNWRPLMTIAEHIGNQEFVEQIKTASLQLSKELEDDSESHGIMLLQDIYDYIKHIQEGHFCSNDLAQYLHGLSERPWSDWNGQLIKPYAIAKLLKPFGICPKKYRLNKTQTIRGYKVDMFEDVFRRYLPGTEEQPQ